MMTLEEAATKFPIGTRVQRPKIVGREYMVGTVVPGAEHRGPHACEVGGAFQSARNGGIFVAVLWDHTGTVGSIGGSRSSDVEILSLPKRRPRDPVPDLPEQKGGSDVTLTKTQEARFDNIVERLIPKIETTFGKTLEDMHIGQKCESEFTGESVAQTIQITSRGVAYNITIAAGREE